MKNNVLLIIPKYFSYEKYIKTQLELLGFDVYMIYENIDEISIKCKFAIKIKKKKKEYLMDYYYRKINNRVFDKVIAIRASTLSIEVLNRIKEKSPYARFYLYQWDSVKNNPNAVNIAPFFDKVLTFDMLDACTYNWKYRPLFYIKSSNRIKKRKIDITYICSLHSQRLKVFERLREYRDLKKFLYIYSKFLHFFKERFLKSNNDFCGCSIWDVKFKALSLDKINEIMGNSNIIVDYTHPGQNGYTMRTCEAIGHKCKLLTNNKMVLESDFYNPQNVHVYDIDNFSIPNEFLKTDFVELDSDTYERYSIEMFLKELLE